MCSRASRSLPSASKRLASLRPRRLLCCASTSSPSATRPHSLQTRSSPSRCECSFSAHSCPLRASRRCRHCVGNVNKTIQNRDKRRWPGQLAIWRQRAKSEAAGAQPHTRARRLRGGRCARSLRTGGEKPLEPAPETPPNSCIVPSPHLLRSYRLGGERWNAEIATALCSG